MKRVQDPDAIVRVVSVGLKLLWDRARCDPFTVDHIKPRSDNYHNSRQAKRIWKIIKNEITKKSSHRQLKILERRQRDEGARDKA